MDFRAGVRRWFLGSAVVLSLLLVAGVGQATAQAKKPSNVVIMGDDIGWFNLAPITGASC